MISRSFPFDLFSERRISGLTCFFYLRSQENIEKIHLKWISHRGAINGWIGLGSDGYLWGMWGKEHLTVLIKFSSCFKVWTDDRSFLLLFVSTQYQRRWIFYWKWRGGYWTNFSRRTWPIRGNLENGQESFHILTTRSFDPIPYLSVKVHRSTLINKKKGRLGTRVRCDIEGYFFYWFPLKS